MDGQVNGWIGEWMDGEGVDAQAGCARRAGRVGNACRHVLRECAAASTLARPPLVPACLPACLSPRLSSRARSIPPCGTSGSSPARPCLCVPNLSVCPPSPLPSFRPAGFIPVGHLEPGGAAADGAVRGVRGGGGAEHPGGAAPEGVSAWLRSVSLGCLSVAHTARQRQSLVVVDCCPLGLSV